MDWRLVCIGCASLVREEFKSIGVLRHADVHCASCGERIRESETDTKPSGWLVVTSEQLEKINKVRGLRG